jgi:hypothetical protein
VDAVRLELREVLAEAGEQVRHHGHVARLRDVREEIGEALRVRRAVVGRHPRPDDQHLRVRGLRGLDHRVEVRTRRVEIAAAQRVVAPELDDHDRRAMLAQERR